MNLKKTSPYFFDTNQVRYHLYKSTGSEGYNWLFLPGGPGADSYYLHRLVDTLELPGNVWMIDLPGNGSNSSDSAADNFDFWIDIFPSVVERFDNPILVGHSFGGMFPLLFPELEKKLKGFVILNSVPVLWLEAAREYSKQFDLPDLKEDMVAFTENPSQETFQVALEACLPYYFPKETLSQGKEILGEMALNYLPAVWWQKKAVELNFSAKWVPENVPTLIVGAKYDCICPNTLFKNDKRFQRKNVEHLYLENAGHFGWLESPKEMKEAFREFSKRLEPIAENAKSPQDHTVIVILESKSGKDKLLSEALSKVAELSRKEDACLEYRFYQDNDNSCRFALFERWKSKELHLQQFSKPYILDFAKQAESLLEKPYEGVIGKMVTK